jgi:predicted PurR-regulated permease PerM
MKVDWNKKYTTIAIYGFLLALSVILVYFFISQVSIFTDKLDYILIVMQPFIIGFSIAYIINFLLGFYENKFFKISYIKKLNIESTKGISIFLSYLTAALILSMIIKFLFPQLMGSVMGLVNDIPRHINTANKFANELINNLNINKEYSSLIIENFNKAIDYIIRFVTNLMPAVGLFIANTISGIWNVVLGIIVSIYLLIDKEKLCGLGRKITYALLNERHANFVVELVHKSNYTFGRFIVGKIIDSAIIGVLTFIILTIFKMPYTLLISFIVGITNIVPFFGPFIGAIPSFIIILFISPIKALWFLVMIFVIQQIDGNFIGPKILGDTIGISAFWILFSILVAGKVLGILGMIIGVPLFAIVYSIIKDIIEAKLRAKGLKIDTKDYINKK